MAEPITRRDFLRLVAAGVAGLAMSACNPKKSSDKPIPIQDLITVPTIEPLPYLPKNERFNREPLPEDIISPENLWRSYHTRIWPSDCANIYLRPGISEIDIFRDLQKRNVTELNIVLLDKKNNLFDDQRKNLPPEVVADFDDYINREGARFSGLYQMTRRGCVTIFIRDYSDDPDVGESRPKYVNEFDATKSNIQTTLRHELAHYTNRSISNGVEMCVGLDTAHLLKKASERFQKTGDDSGFFVVVDTPKSVVIS